MNNNLTTNQRLAIAVLVIAILAITLSVLLFVFEEDGSDIVTFVPIWFIILLVPLLSTKKEPTPRDKKWLKILVALGLAAFVAGLLVFAM
ncbi:MAG: hypothetical protein JXB14_07325 [Candidatus Altiarchaeota archaeon]|nr:hypothetical protein [Candidatus Altiarchaeota archaeon]